MNAPNNLFARQANPTRAIRKKKHLLDSLQHMFDALRNVQVCSLTCGRQANLGAARASRIRGVFEGLGSVRKKIVQSAVRQ
jgi:hypothetical protein